MREIYFDNSATTPLSGEVINKMTEVMTLHYGNPSSVHSRGLDAERILSEARSRVISALGVKDRAEGILIFTSCGTEANNMAITGTLNSKSFRFKPRIITTDSEHPAVLAPIAEAEKNLCEVVRLSTKDGRIDTEQYTNALTPNTVLVSVMRVNNETGAIYPVEKLFELARERCPDAVTHCDAIQGFCKIGCSPKKLNADLISVSAHKIGGPKGVGALWCDKTLITKRRILPIIHGGGQESGYRSGTENIIGISGFGEAARQRAALMNSDREKIILLREQLISGLPSGAKVNTPFSDYLPNIISITLDGIKSEVMVRALSSKGIMISAGSACSARNNKVSGALVAFGHDIGSADSTVRVSLSADNSQDEVEIFLCELEKLQKTLQRKR